MNSINNNNLLTKKSDKFYPFKVTILAAVYEAPEVVNRFIDSVSKVMDATDHSYEIFLVDDGSEHETWEAICSAKRISRYVRGCKLSRNFGKEAAVLAGLEFAKGEAVVIMDADLQYPPELLPRFISLWENGKIPIVQGVRIDRSNQGRAQRIMSKIYYTIFRFLTGVDLENSTDFVLLDRRIVTELMQFKERQTYFRGLTNWIGYEHATIPFKIAPRTQGESGWNLLKLIKHAFLAMTSFSAKPVYLIMFVGLIGLVGSFIMSLQTLYNWVSGTAYPGFSTVILLQLIFGSLELFSVGLIGAYIVNIFIEVKHRPRYLIDNTTDVIRDISKPVFPNQDES